MPHPNTIISRDKDLAHHRIVRDKFNMDNFPLNSDVLSRCSTEQKEEIETMNSICSDNEFAWDPAKASGYLKITCKLDSALEVSCRVRERGASGKADKDSEHKLISGSSRINHLPPLTLHFELPALYPAEQAPLFTLSSCWLNFTQVSAVAPKVESLMNFIESNANTS